MNKLKKELELILDRQKKQWKHFSYAEGGFYQSLKQAEIKGKRNTEERFEDYEIKRFLTKDKISLDIGANTGFFSIYISPHLNSCDCVEINPFLCEIGEKVAEHLDINNIQFHNFDFARFQTNKKYDIIMSFASDEVADRITNLNFEQYMGKIYLLLKEDGLLFFEFQAEDIMFDKWQKKFDYIKEKFIITFQKDLGSNYPYNVKSRKFLIGIKK